MNLKCKLLSCDNNTGFGECMYGITPLLIAHELSGKPMCNILREEVRHMQNKIKVVLDEGGTDGIVVDSLEDLKGYYTY